MSFEFGGVNLNDCCAVYINCVCIQKSLDKSGRSQSGQLKSGSRQEVAPLDIDMEEAPTMSDGDVCMPATSQSPHLASAAVSASFLAFLIRMFFYTPLRTSPSFHFSKATCCFHICHVTHNFFLHKMLISENSK